MIANVLKNWKTSLLGVATGAGIAFLSSVQGGMRPKDALVAAGLAALHFGGREGRLRLLAIVAVVDGRWALERGHVSLSFGVNSLPPLCQTDWLLCQRRFAHKLHEQSSWSGRWQSSPL